MAGMTVDGIYQLLLNQFGEEQIRQLHTESKDPWIEVAAGSIASVAEHVKSTPELAFDLLCNLTGVDYFETSPKLVAKFPYTPHVEVVYHLYSIRHRHRLVLKVHLPRWQDETPGRLPEIPTVSHVWGIADWHEREAFDLVGIHFLGHPNLVRILCPDDWVGHPLRKEYELPLEYHGIRGK